jgi:prepilin-type N-terminal cleavage/methylation domain-containing protein
MRIRTGGYGGFTILELMIVMAVIGMLIAIALPSFVKTRDTSQLTAVYNNLRIIEYAKDQWALENKKGTGDSTGLPALSDFLKGGTIKPVVHEVYEANLIGSPAYATTSVRLGTYAPTDPISIP